MLGRLLRSLFRAPAANGPTNPQSMPPEPAKQPKMTKVLVLYYAGVGPFPKKKTSAVKRTLKPKRAVTKSAPTWNQGRLFRPSDDLFLSGRFCRLGSGRSK
jgi:hypothetical protein